MNQIETILDILIKGFAIGVIVSAPLGPVGVLCIQRTLNKGRWYGFVTGLGASLSDIAYALLTGYGMSFIFDYIDKNIFYLQLLGSIMLLLLEFIHFVAIRSNPFVRRLPTKVLIFIISSRLLPSLFPIHSSSSCLLVFLPVLLFCSLGCCYLRQLPDIWL